MSDVIIQNGKTFTVVDITDTHQKLPIANYLVRYNEITDSFSLEVKAEFNLPDKIYGDFSYIERWKKSFESSTKNLGILLSGYKGNGKTLTAQHFCRLMNTPVIFITSGFKGASFESFITNPVFNGCIVFIDEYEKLYNGDTDNEEALLSIMDGIYNTHLIFLLTVNDSRELSDKLKNRLGRIKYHKQYSSIDTTVIEEAIDDLLINQEHRPSIMNILEIIPTISFDILVSLIKEVNLFNEPATECIKHLNIVKEDSNFEITVSDGKKRRLAVERFFSLPDGYFNIYYQDEDYGAEDEKWPYGRIYLRNYDLVKISGGVKFKYNETYEITLIRSEIEPFLFF